MHLPDDHDYWRATRHPWPSFLFLLPLLLVYEIGVVFLDGTRGDMIRNGADAFLRWLLEASGFQQFFWAPVLLVVGLLAWNWRRRHDRPADLLGTCSGMALESVLYALLLWGMSKELDPLLHRMGVALGNYARVQLAYAQLVAFIGAGLYEEVLFRLVLLCGLLWLLKEAHIPYKLAVVPAAVTAAVTFAAVHHVGAYGEPFDAFVFLFRTLAGCYFAGLFLCRGLGIAVGAHACYDIIVGAF